MKILIDYKPPCSIDILSQYGVIEYESKNMTIVVLNTNEAIENIKKIDGVATAYEEVKCWICEAKMNFIEITEVVMIDRKVKKYKCPKCGEIIYEPININSNN